MTRTIHFYFDYISSNAYLAWARLPTLARTYECSIEPVPVLFAGLLEAYGQLGPAEVAVKAMWMGKNNLRKAAVLGIPLNPPKFHPFNPLLALRASSLPMADDRRHALITALFDAVWVRRLHVSEPDVVRAMANEVGLDGEAVIERASLPETKALLRSQTDNAVGLGVFGVPSMQFDGEVFWGHDDIPYLELRLAGRDPLDPVEWAEWIEAPRASAVRRRFRATEESR
jgi:2-hydroxychromene-2-carboxylate isomerase